VASTFGASNLTTVCSMTTDSVLEAPPTPAAETPVARRRPRPVLKAVSRWSVGLLIFGLALALWLIYRSSFIAGDTAYSLVWAREILGGHAPTYEGGPTPHPLVNAISALTLLLTGSHAEAASAVAAYVSLSGMIVLAAALAARWFGRAAAVVTAAVLLTRPPIFPIGTSTYTDTLFVTLALGALYVLTLSPAASFVPLLLLGAAGLLRPEAWIFGGAFALWRVGQTESWTRRLQLLAAAAAPAVVWVVADLAATGDPLYSFVGTRTLTAQLEHSTGIGEVPSVLPTGLADTFGRPLVVIGAVGVLLAAAVIRRRAWLPLASLALALVALVLEAAAGLPILGRYMLLTGTVVVIFAAGTIVGWTVVPTESRFRRPWIVVGALAALLICTYVPNRVDTLRQHRASFAVYQRGHDDAKALIERVKPSLSCGPLSVPSDRMVPFAALWLHTNTKHVGVSQIAHPRTGTYLVPAAPEIRQRFYLDRHGVSPTDPRQALAQPPSSFRVVASNASWRLYQHCE
jgi:hypothetical protein